MGLLAHSWFEIMEFRQSFQLSGAGKRLSRGRGQISVKRDSIFELDKLARYLC